MKHTSAPSVRPSIGKAIFMIFKSQKTSPDTTENTPSVSARDLAREAAQMLGIHVAWTWGNGVRTDGAQRVLEVSNALSANSLRVVFSQWLPRLCMFHGVLLSDVLGTPLDDDEAAPNTSTPDSQIVMGGDTLFQRVLLRLDFMVYESFLENVSNSLSAEEARADNKMAGGSDSEMLNEGHGLLDRLISDTLGSGNTLLGEILTSRLLNMEGNERLSKEKTLGLVALMRHTGERGYLKCLLPENYLSASNGFPIWSAGTPTSILGRGIKPRWFRGAGALAEALRVLLLRGVLHEKTGMEAMELAEKWAVKLGVWGKPTSWEVWANDNIPVDVDDLMMFKLWSRGESLLDEVPVQRKDALSFREHDDVAGMGSEAKDETREETRKTREGETSSGHYARTLPAWHLWLVRSCGNREPGLETSGVIGALKAEKAFLEEHGESKLGLKKTVVDARIHKLEQAAKVSRRLVDCSTKRSWSSAKLARLLTHRDGTPLFAGISNQKLFSDVKPNARGESALLYLVRSTACQGIRLGAPGDREAAMGGEDGALSLVRETLEKDFKRVSGERDALGFSLEFWASLREQTLELAKDIDVAWRAFGQERQERQDLGGTVMARSSEKNKRLGCEGEGLVAAMAGASAWFSDTGAELSMKTLYQMAQIHGIEIVFGDKLGQRYWVKRLDAFFDSLAEKLQGYRGGIGEQVERVCDGDPEKKHFGEGLSRLLTAHRFCNNDTFSGFEDIHLLLDTYRTVRSAFARADPEMAEDDRKPAFDDHNHQKASRGELLVDEKLETELAERLNVLSTLASAMGPVGLATYKKDFGHNNSWTSWTAAPREELGVGAQPGRTVECLTRSMADVLDAVIESCNTPLVLRRDLPFVANFHGSDSSSMGASEKETERWKKQWRATIDRWLLSHDPAAEEIKRGGDIDDIGSVGAKGGATKAGMIKAGTVKVDEGEPGGCETEGERTFGDDNGDSVENGDGCSTKAAEAAEAAGVAAKTAVEKTVATEDTTREPAVRRKSRNPGGRRF